MPSPTDSLYQFLDCTPVFLGLFCLVIMVGIAVFGLGYFTAMWLIDRICQWFK